MVCSALLVIMEDSEMEMTKEDFQEWIRMKLKDELFIEVEEKCKLLQSLLDRRKKLSVHLQQLCRSVATCEALVKKQYSLLGWEYRETDSDDNQSVTDCEKSPLLAHEFSQNGSEEATNGVLPRVEAGVKICDYKGKKITLNMKRQPVVLLTRLSPRELSSLRLPASQIPSSGDESSKTSDEDELQEADDSDVSLSSLMTPNKRRKLERKDEKLDTTSPSTDSSLKAVKCVQTKASTKRKESTIMEVAMPPAKNKGRKTSTLRQSLEKVRKEAYSRQTGKICAGMSVLARSGATGWQKGRVLKTVTKDGRVTYKIKFEDKSGSLVSGHHMAFEWRPRLNQLKVGTRVVIERKDTTPQYSPGFLAELPSWKNRMRFLVFLDDHTPHYVALPSLHLVCKPLANPLKEIANKRHRNFMKEYIREWPFLPQTDYMIGETINAELNGVQQKCVVEAVDCSLIQVLFLKDQQMDWIYCGSTRLEGMMKLRSYLRKKKMHPISTAIKGASKLAQ